MLVKDEDNPFAATASASGARIISREANMSSSTQESEGKEKERADVQEERSLEQSEDIEFQPIIIDGGCLCSLLRYRITIPAEFQKTELYQQLVGFSHCYCYSCRNAGSALARTSLKFPRDMVKWTSRAKIVEPEPESSAIPERSSRSRRGSRSSLISVPKIAETEAPPLSTTGYQPSKVPRDEGVVPSSSPRQFLQYQKQKNKLQSTLEVVQQDPEFETEFNGIDNALGCCCNEDEELQEQVPPPPAEGSRRTSLGKTPWSGNTGYHRRIWKRDRGVGGRGSVDHTASSSEMVPAESSPSAPSTPPAQSPLLSPREQSPVVEEPTKGKDKEKGKGKAKEGLWSRLINRQWLNRVDRKAKANNPNLAKMKGKAAAAISSKDKGKSPASTTTPSSQPPEPISEPDACPQSLVDDGCMESPKVQPSGRDIVSIPTVASPTASSLEILRWETQLLHQQESDRCCTTNKDSDDFDGDPQNTTLPVPWPFKEFALTTRDGRTSYRGFCSWCGGSLTYRTSASIHGMIDIMVGSMDDPKTALKEVGFLKEFHCDMAGEVEVGARLGTRVGNRRDEGVVKVDGCTSEVKLQHHGGDEVNEKLLIQEDLVDSD
ncbi:hypothetical protein H072_10291 [Dactylellina haptotyla CBS 200.50]|uniref:CENP-V/GFA domain-containing protein n=1 Tax=Dactylellina haptotyla (strain CBS 200.50) TaxID=1284197 RepID=S8BLX4_DACHA|nr:hypothetical protein H072_10291 [Dactylellina haptotyla CBS 200.50]